MPSNSNGPKPYHAGHRERIKQRFCSSGLDCFLDHEVLELLLTYTIPRRDTKPIAWDMIRRFGSVSSALDAKREELMEIKGIGEESVIFISFIRALLRRYFLDELKQKSVIKSPLDVVNYCRASLEGEKDEIFEVLYLTTKNTVISAERVAVGTIDRASVAPRKVVESALKMRAASLIFVHNHPSGLPEPSDNDIALTEELIKAARTLGLSVHDHIIVGKSSYYSFRANGLIKRKEPSGMDEF